MTYFESAEGETVSKERALQETVQALRSRNRFRRIL